MVDRRWGTPGAHPVATRAVLARGAKLAPPGPVFVQGGLVWGTYQENIIGSEVKLRAQSLPRGCFH